METDKLKNLFNTDAFSGKLGIEFVEVEEGYTKTRMALGPDSANFMGMPHGAAIYAVADAAFSGAVNSLGTMAVAMNVDINYVAAPPLDGVLTAEARTVHVGKRTTTCRIDVFDDQGNLIAWCAALAFRKDTPLP